ncbi:chorismate mutase [Streptomyces sp. NPDC046203]|uniref:chorismate mutase n=1 Tax=Streptomyces sp. NPDC046203 TaxID=3154602 RepID=UPI0033F76CFC
MSAQTLQTPQPVASPPSAEIVIAGLRDRIDLLDAEILRLLDSRRAFSEAIQDARISSGGRRTELGRENVVINRYADRLGRPGGKMAMAVLEFCRGSLTRPAA